jgi:hypothetical protein
MTKIYVIDVNDKSDWLEWFKASENKQIFKIY